MRVLLDENLPVDLAPALTGRQAETVSALGWTGIKNGELLARAAGRFDAMLTMDRTLEFQQPLAKQPFGVVLIRAASNRMDHLRPLIPQILDALNGIRPGEIRRVGATTAKP